MDHIKVHDWSEWATADSYRMSDLFIHPSEAVALNIAARLDGTVYHIKEGYVVSLPDGTMVSTITHVKHINSAMLSVVR